MATASGDAFITTEKLAESTAKLSQNIGVSKEYSSDGTGQFTKITDKKG